MAIAYYVENAMKTYRSIKNPQMTEADFIAEFIGEDVAPVRHSYWESYDTSACIGTDDEGEPRWVARRFYVCHERKCRYKSVVRSKYCPNCGAKMDLGGTDNGE